MAITQSKTYDSGIVQRAQGRYLDDAGTPGAMAITLGFTPRYVRVINLTDRIEFEWFEGMTATHALKTVAAGTRTLETSGGITVSSTAQNFSLAAAAVLQNKQYSWVATG